MNWCGRVLFGPLVEHEEIHEPNFNFPSFGNKDIFWSEVHAARYIVLRAEVPDRRETVYQRLHVAVLLAELHLLQVVLEEVVPFDLLFNEDIEIRVLKEPNHFHHPFIVLH